ncbi:MAG TPA: metallophosphoesterase [Thermoplasmata archaeon]|jgi:putative SbcD/Mre11-related phosphoesterase
MAAVGIGVSLRRFRVSERMEIIPGGAALLTDDNVLVVADMHLGCEAALEYEGLSIPRVQTKRIENYMKQVVQSIGPRRVIVAGDLKHNFSRNLTQEWRDVSRFVGVLRGLAPLEVIKGNHDNYLGAILAGFDVPLRKEVTAGGVRILHGHLGEPKPVPTVIGHIHPSVRLKDDIGVSVKDHCFLHHEDLQMLVLPALSLVANGLDVMNTRSDSSSPLLPEDGLSGFHPVLFSGDRPLSFPEVSRLRP